VLGTEWLLMIHRDAKRWISNQEPGLSCKSTPTACAYWRCCIMHAYWSLLPCRYCIKLACQFREARCRLSRSVSDF